jgi:ATP-binding cassette subfamily F protein uup
LRREVEWLRRQPKARTGKQKARIDRAEDAIAAAPTRRHEDVRKLELMAARAGSTVLELRGLSLERGGHRLIEGLDLVIGRGDRIGVVGRNGAGKSSLLHVLRGELEPTAGACVVGKNARIAYLDQARGDLDDDASILENVAGSRRTVELHGREVDVRGWLGGFLFSADKQRAKVGTLSGGERARVALARLLLSPANILLLDEPTNDLDVTTLGALEDMLLESRATAIVVTHDRYFLDRVATAILAFEGDGQVVRYAGDYSMFQATRTAHRASAAETARAEAAATEPGTRARPEVVGTAPSAKPLRRGLTYGERIELEGLMDRVGSAEEAVSRLETALADPALYAERGAEVPSLTVDLEAARADLERLLARWEELEEKREAT